MPARVRNDTEESAQSVPEFSGPHQHRAPPPAQKHRTEAHLKGESNEKLHFYNPESVPLYFSDTPRSLKRQYVILKDSVSEHVCSLTCACLKCRKFASDRPTIGPKKRTTTFRDSDCRALTRGVQENLSTRDFGWLLAKIGEPSMRTENTIELNMPETIILEKGKPRKMFYLNTDGKILMAPLTTAAELFRVLKNFVKLAYRKEAKAIREAANPSHSNVKRTHSSLVVPGTKNAFVRENMLSVAQDVTEDRTGMDPIEIAVLYYHDGAVRSMTDVEANLQMQGRNKLPHAFWVDIAMLQGAVHSCRKGYAMQYITYYYDLKSVDSKASFESWANAKSCGFLQTEETEQRHAIQHLPKHVSSFLLKKADYEVVSGQFDIMRDCADNSLWLRNVTHLKVNRVPIGDRMRASLAPLIGVKGFEESHWKMVKQELQKEGDKDAHSAWQTSCQMDGQPEKKYTYTEKLMELEMDQFWASKTTERKSFRQRSKIDLAPISDSDNSPSSPARSSSRSTSNLAPLKSFSRTATAPDLASPTQRKTSKGMDRKGFLEGQNPSDDDEEAPLWDLTPLLRSHQAR